VVSGDKLADLVQSLGAIVWEADARTFRFTFVSGQAEAILGYPAAEWLADPDFWRRHTHPADLERCAKFCLDATRQERDHQFEYRMIAADGHVVWLRDIVTVKHDAHGRTMLAGIMLDITRQKEDEDQLHAMDRFYRALLENSSDNIAMLSATGVTVYQSSAVERQLGYRPEELIGRNNFELVHADDREMAMLKFQETFSTDDVIGPVRFKGVHKDGHTVMLESLAKRFVDDAGATYMICNTRDINEQTRLEAQLSHATKMEALGQLAGGVAHDFNNLLTVITGYTEMVHERLEPGDDRRHDIEEIRRAADRATVLTSQLLAFSRKQVLHTKVQDLNTIVREVGGMIGRVIGETIELQLELAEDCAPIMADRSQVEQVLLNLAVNARDAMPFGGTLTLRTALDDVDANRAARRGAPRPGRYVCLAVKDTGSGMSSEVQRRIFEPFYTTKPPGKGTGLGLSTVYGIVKQSGGSISVDSAPHRGTTFTVHLPAATTERAQEPAAEPQPSAPPGRETVLLVEDEPRVRSLTEEILTRQGYRVFSAANGAEALRVCREHPGAIDLLVTDIVMAGMSGPELAAKIESTRPHTAVLYISGYAGDSVLGTSSEEGVAFLQKPFTPAALARKVRDLLDERSS
jgi:two-component system, cell cycle sensor histidine kinase and response regulator CckA